MRPEPPGRFRFDQSPAVKVALDVGYVQPALCFYRQGMDVHESC
jgi:hypothetical protein